MFIVVWLELKGALRGISWWIIAAFSAGLAFLLGNTDVPVLSTASMGEWGRSVLIISFTAGFIFTAILTSQSVSNELAHRQVLWATGLETQLVMHKLLGVSLAVFLAIATGSTIAFLAQLSLNIFAPTGILFTCFYLLWTVINVLFWTVLTGFFSYLTQSRIITIFVLVLGGEGFNFVARFLPPVVKFLIPPLSLLPGGLPNPYAPFGTVPTACFLGGASTFGAAIGLLGGTLLIRRLFPEWRRVKKITPIGLVLLGLGIMIAGGYGVGTNINAKIAPFTTAELLSGKAPFDRLYVYDKDGTPLITGEQFMAVCLPSGHPLPAWIKERSVGRSLYCSRVPFWAPAAATRGHFHQTITMNTVDLSLVLIYPTDSTCPSELNKAATHLMRLIRPMVDEANLWWKTNAPRRVIVVPNQIGNLPFSSLPDSVWPTHAGLLIASRLVTHRMDIKTLWEIAWGLAGAANLDDAKRAYLSLYLMDAVNTTEVERSLRYYHKLAGELKTWVSGTMRFAMWPPCGDKASHVLDYWKQGETMGHEKFIRKLLKGVKRDQGGGAR